MYQILEDPVCNFLNTIKFCLPPIAERPLKLLNRLENFLWTKSLGHYILTFLSFPLNFDWNLCSMEITIFGFR